MNVLVPGPIATPMQEEVLTKEAKEMFESLIPRGTMGQPEEIATVALVSCFDDSSFVNGVELDGGLSAIVATGGPQVIYGGSPHRNRTEQNWMSASKAGIISTRIGETTMSYAIVGFGKIGQALAQAFARKNINVIVASRRPPEALAPQARAIGPRSSAKSLRMHSRPTQSSWRSRSGNIARLRRPCRTGKARRSSTR